MIHFCMIFWTDGQENSTRERNVRLTWDYLKHMVQYFNDKNIPSIAKLFDYSPAKLIEDAIHIPYPMYVYKKSEKLNNIIYNLSDEDYVCLIDSDIFIHKIHWDNLGKLLQEIRYEVGYFFNLAKLQNGPDFINLDDVPRYHPYSLAYEYGRAGGFGGFYIASVKSIKDLGGYDEKFTTWGGEDGELMDRFYQKFIRIGVSEKTVLPFHLPHFEDRENILYFNQEEYIMNNYILQGIEL